MYKNKEDKKAYEKKWYQTIGKEKKKASNERWRLKKLEEFKELKSLLRCNRCHEDHPACLDFHHKDPLTKEVGIANVRGRWSNERILKEIEKCEILCANCHRKEHYQQQQASNA